MTSSPHVPHRTYDPNRLLDALAGILHADGDVMLGRILKISPRILKSMRLGKMPIRGSILMGMAECTGTSTDELRRILGDRRGRVRAVFPGLPRHSRVRHLG